MNFKVVNTCEKCKIEYDCSDYKFCHQCGGKLVRQCKYIPCGNKYIDVFYAGDETSANIWKTVICKKADLVYNQLFSKQYVKVLESFDVFNCERERLFDSGYQYILYDMFWFCDHMLIGNIDERYTLIDSKADIIENKSIANNLTELNSDFGFWGLALEWRADNKYASITRLTNMICKKYGYNKGDASFIAVIVFNFCVIKYARNMMERSFKKYDGNLDNYIAYLIENGFDYSNTQQIYMLIYYLYAIRYFKSYGQIPIYNQYVDVCDKIESIVDGIAQSDFEDRFEEDHVSTNTEYYSIFDADCMTGKEFEQLLCDLFRKSGYVANVTQDSNDYGIDILLQKTVNNHIYHEGIQAKRYSGKVGIDAIQEAISGKGFYKLDKVFVVTNSWFTRQAVKLAAANDVVLWDRDILDSNLQRAKIKIGE